MPMRDPLNCPLRCGQSGMSREAQSSPLSTWPGVNTYNTLRGCFNASWDEALTTFQWQITPPHPHPAPL